MGKMWVELCIVSARGLHRSSLLKLQWFAVAWVDPNDKYCTRIDGSGNPNPVWRTKFSAEVDSDDDCTLHVEVYSRETLFLREKLHGSAEVSLKGFIGKKKTIDEIGEDLGSFQLRRKGSAKPMGFVDVSFRISPRPQMETATASDCDGFELPGNSNVISLEREAGAVRMKPQGLYQLPFTHQPNPAPQNYTYTHPIPYPSNYNNPSLGGPSYLPASVPGFNPNAPSSYLNLQPSAGAGGVRPGFAAGMGAGALAAGAVIFGDGIMSGFDPSLWTA